MKTTYLVCRHGAIVAVVCAAFQAGLVQAKEREEFHQTYPLTSDGKVHVDHVTGTIRVTTWDRAEVKVDAVKTASNKGDLDSVRIEVDSKADSVRIHTKHPNSNWSWKPWRHHDSGSVDYEIKVPANANLDEIETVNGSVEIEGVK